MKKKYELYRLADSDCFQLVALRDFDDVQKGDRGGIVTSKVIISHDDNSWVYPRSYIEGNVIIMGDSKVIGNTRITSKHCKLTINNSRIKDSLIEIKNDLRIEHSNIEFGFIRKQNDFECVDPDESMTVFKNRDGSMLLKTDGFDHPLDLDLGLELITYSNRYDKIIQDVSKWKKKQNRFKLFL